MSTTDAARPASAGGKSPHLSINLSSNNPFRNRAPSPLIFEGDFASPASPFDDPEPRPRPVSRNPFFDPSQQPLKSPDAMSSNSDSKVLPTDNIFDSLTLDETPAEKPKASHAPPPPPRLMNRQPPPRGGDDAWGSSGERRSASGSRHRPTPSQENEMRSRKPGSGPGPRPGPPVARPSQRRPRRNSDTSLIDLDVRPITDEERKMIEERRRENEKRRREGRERESRDRDGKERDGKDREGKDRDGKDKSRSHRPSRRMDIIDKLDATSIYGTGLFHHDGPFDALNPHRNRHNSRRAPMQAFPKDSLNNSLGGAGPLNKQADHSTFLGMATEEAFRDYAGSKTKTDRKEPPIFDSNLGAAPIHGDESVGLGTSTFLEGTPAARSAIVRHQVEQAQDAVENGMQRKKSLAHRIRNINKGPRDYGSSARSPPGDGMYSRRSPSALSPGTSGNGEANPFLFEFSKGDESISVRPRDGGMSPDMGMQRPEGANLERRATTDATMPADEAPSKPSGILGRMKSLKGPRKPRNTDAPPPGTAV